MEQSSRLEELRFELLAILSNYDSGDVADEAVSFAEEVLDCDNLYDMNCLSHGIDLWRLYL